MKGVEGAHTIMAVKLMKINRTWAMPNKWTFKIKPINELLSKYVKDEGGRWIDPFAGKYSFAEYAYTNDLNPEMPSKYHQEAYIYLQEYPDDFFEGGLFDPPYSPRQVKECYEGFGRKVTFSDTKCTFYSKVKDELARIIKPDGLAICCGWNSMGLGKGRGFKQIEILLVAHGGNKNDTIVTVERKTEGVK